MSDRHLSRVAAVVLGLTVGLSACGAGGSSRPATAPPARQAALLRLTSIGRFDSPLYVTAPPGDRTAVFVVEQGGRIWVVRNGRRVGRPFLDISSQVTAGGEQGLLSMAFAPDYARSRRFYVYYTNRNGDNDVAQFQRSAGNPNLAVRSSERLVLSKPQPESNHNGGSLLFGPDGLLYIGSGDGGGANDHHGSRGNGQSLDTLLGKLLRIDPLPGGGYRIPRGNPFVGRAGARGEIYDYGLRNPWRFTFDRGNLIIADVGQDRAEEIDFAPRGRTAGLNFGWRVFEGFLHNYPDESAPGAVPPVFTYSHEGGACALTGGVVVRDPRLRGWIGSYLYGDFCDGRMRAIRLRAGGACCDRRAAPSVPNLSSFGEDARRRVYATSLSGPVYRLDP
jgi:glucose/arabinose dehydrogenase